MPPKKRTSVKQGESLKPAPKGPEKIDANADVAPPKTLPSPADDEDQNPKDPNAPKPEGSTMTPALGEQLVVSPQFTCTHCVYVVDTVLFVAFRFRCHQGYHVI